MTLKTVNLQVSKKGVRAVTQKSQSASSKKKTTRNKKKKSTVAQLAEGTLSSQGGSLSEVQSHALNVRGKMEASSPLTNDGKSAIMTILNPCGELGTDANAKFPDGTLSQSGIQRFRQFETIVAPWQTISASANVTNNWSLYIISPSAFRTAAIFVAVKDGRALSDVQFNQVFNTINMTINNPNYPDWQGIGFNSELPEPDNENIFYSIYSFRSATLDIDPGTGESKTLESFRLVGDGMVVLHNTPDLWNQGSFAVGQFKTDFAVVETDTTSWPVVFEVATELVSAARMIGTVELYTTLNGAKVTLGFVEYNVTTADPQEMGITSPGPTFTLSLRAPVGDLFYQHAPPAVREITFNFDLTPGSFGVNLVGNVPDADILKIATPESGSNYTYVFQGLGALFDQEYSNPSQIIWSLPSLNQDSIAQADPKFSAELMKCHDGFYAVRRYFEPVLNMTLSNNSGPIKMELAGINKQDVIDAPGGIRGDILDKNGATIIAALRGISYACSPTIKTVRYVEFMPAPNSALAAFVGPCPPKDEDAVEVFRQMQTAGPHSYIPDANFLGGLATFIMSVVEKVPVFLRTARSISTAVISAIDWADSKLTSLGMK